MPILILLLSLSFLNSAPARLTVIDKNLVQPLFYATDFTVASYFDRKFPINSSDLNAVVAATEKAAKMIDRKSTLTKDTLRANQTIVIIDATDKKNAISVRLFTVLEDNGMSFDFELVSNEFKWRKAQRKLMDFAAYLQK